MTTTAGSLPRHLQPADLNAQAAIVATLLSGQRGSAGADRSESTIAKRWRLTHDRSGGNNRPRREALVPRCFFVSS
jgi:hypothetical protein